LELSWERISGKANKLKEFPPFRLDTENQCLWRRGEGRGDERILLTPKAFAVLRYLVEHAGRLVTQEELLEAVWPDTFVQPEVLKYQIADVRSTLGDRPKNPLFIETLPRRGYRFAAAVSEGAPAEPAASPAGGGRLVGRDRELARLRAALKTALRGQHQVVFITGEPGIGKTALADEFRRQAAAAEPSLRIARGQCLEGYGGKEPYYPMLEALGELCRGPEGEPVVRILASQAPTWLVQFPALIKREHRESLQREILGATRERMLREIGDALEAIAAARPLLLTIEDLHWGDPSTVDLISALARRRGAAKLMVLGTCRPVELESSNHALMALTRDLLVHQLCCQIALEPLTEAEIAEYLTAEAPGTRPPEALAALLYRCSEGNPLLMLAALEHLGERGAISREQGHWQLRVAPEEVDLNVPEGLFRTIETYIERHSTEEQRVLEVASLQSVGRSRFAVASRAELAGLDPEAFEAVCETLSRRYHVMRPAAESDKFADGTVSACYEFVHAAYREVCYRRIAPRRRANLHKRLGEWIEAHHEPLNEAAAWLAGHFEQGGDWLRAVKYLRLEADTAGRRFEPRQAAQILEHALDLARKLPEAERTASEIEILEKLAAIYAVLGESTRAIEIFEAMAARAAQDGLIDVEVRALIDMAWPLSWISSQRSLEVLEQALRLTAQLEDPALRARMRARCFAWRLWQGWNPQDVEGFHNAAAEISSSDDRPKLAPYLVDCGFIRCIASEYREAHRNLIESRAIKFEAFEENPYLNPAYVRSQLPLTLSLLFMGEWGEALREIRDAIAILDKNADYHWGQGVRPHLAWVHLCAMDFAGVLALCNSAIALTGDPGPRPASGYPAPYRFGLWKRLFLMGSAETALGDYERALGHLLAARADMDRPGPTCMWYWRMPLECALAELWLAKGDLAQARPQAERFLEIALASAEHMWQALAWEANARLAVAELDRTRAQDSIAKALSAMEGFEVPLARWRVHATAGELYRNSGDRDLAERHIALSRETIMKLANSLPADEPLRQIFLSAPMISKILGTGETPSVTATKA
jgi:DNA-binding winged helix-turn-helix (wHTH) protein/tetratricopeptide (TPR) repeat protein